MADSLATDPRTGPPGSVPLPTPSTSASAAAGSTRASPLGGGTSQAASAPPSPSPSDPASRGPADGPTLAAAPPQDEVRVPWIEPGWLVLVLLLVPVLAAPLLLLIVRGAMSHGQHRRR